MRAVMVLASGTALAHGLTAAALPVLSRLYTPADFGMLAVFSSVLLIIAVAACLRYDVAVAIPTRDDDALHLLVLAIAIALCISAVLTLPVVIAPAWISQWLSQPGLAPYLWLLPVGVLLAGAYSALQFWYVRQRRFTLLARTRVVQSASSAGTQIGLGWWAAAGPVGLLLGYVMNTGIACLALGGQVLRTAPTVSVARMRALAVEYSRFPKYSTVEALANSAATQLPIIMIAALAAPAEAGFLMMAMYVMQAAMSLIGTAISQVYLSRAPEVHVEGKLGAYTAGILGGLFKAGVGPLLAAGILSPILFSLVFGADWQRAGWLAAWMTPSFLLQFLAVPVSMALHVTGHQRVAMYLQLAGLALRVSFVWGVAQWQSAWVAEAYAVSGGIFYLGYLLVILRAVRAPWSGVVQGLGRGLLTGLLWVATALTSALGIHLITAVAAP